MSDADTQLSDFNPAPILSLVGITYRLPKFFGREWNIWKGAIDERGLDGDEAQDVHAMTIMELDATKMRFEACLRAGEKSIQGEEKSKRLLTLGKPLAGARQFFALWLDYRANGKKSVLEWLRREKGITYLDFFGTILRNPKGSRCVLCLDWFAGRWRFRFRWLGNNWFASDVSVVLESETPVSPPSGFLVPQGFALQTEKHPSFATGTRGVFHIFLFSHPASYPALAKSAERPFLC